ncbi:uncharacterized protein F4822DRAFT_54886 [Hypoxylon trugodes]|uniref:uncharacterized protein n=1 Tax=Hypoxylon trugodes TaxID=326681 RepID=UPI00218FC2EE|nr:uncharacterized protein F4822DRAFT_54886 [Hypoxylon trugodes]KAI1383908.1 hypothetical protein F4822DRAFT_54886 [Hypoxylon trugodes]
MNRLCQSSFGYLEAVIGFVCQGKTEKRTLINFYRNNQNGEWCAGEIISRDPHSGGSIIQNSTQRVLGQQHGDFEVIVLEENGLLRHYTRNNTLPFTESEDTSEENGTWKLSATINEQEHKIYGKVVVFAAAPIYQSNLPSGNTYEGTTLETAVLTDKREILHYRCPQSDRDPRGRCYQWKLCIKITDGAIGPACLYQDAEKRLKALIPFPNGINEFYFTDEGDWDWGCHIPDSYGPACIYSPNPSNPSAMDMIVVSEDKLCVRARREYEYDEVDQGWSISSTTNDELPSSLKRLPRGSYFQPFQGNPMAAVSPTFLALRHSPNTEAIVFHPCRTKGTNGRWMILHWSYLTTVEEWMVSGVAVDYVKGIVM